MGSFAKAGYTAIYPKEGAVLEESLVSKLKAFENLKIADEKIIRNEDGFATIVYAKTRPLKRLIETDKSMQGLLANSEARLADIIAGRSMALAADTQRGARIPVSVYISKTLKGETTFLKDLVEHESAWPQRIKTWAPGVALTAMVGTVIGIAVKLANVSTQMAEEQAKQMQRATEYNSSGKNDGLDQAIEARSSQSPENHRDAENKKREERNKPKDKKSPGIGG